MSDAARSNLPIGVYDSGIGGLSVLRVIQSRMPAENIIYVADQAHVPYGNRPMEEIRSLAEGVTRFLLSQGAKLIVIACNTASAAALKDLRVRYPQVLFVGMEPAVKPAAEQTLSGHVGVLATPSTFQGELYASVVERFAQDVTLHQATCPGLVSQIEKGFLRSAKTKRILQDAVEPMLSAGVDTLVMGCTHFPFVIPVINEISHGQARVIDPAPAIARQVERVLSQNGLLNSAAASGQVAYLTSGDPLRMKKQIALLLGAAADPRALRWSAGTLLLAEPL